MTVARIHEPVHRRLVDRIADTVERAALLAEFEQLLGEVRAAAPPTGSPQEAALLRRFIDLQLRLMRALGDTAVDWTDEELTLELEELIRDELEHGQVTAKLGLRHLQRAVEVFGTLVVHLRVAMRGLSITDLLPDPDAAFEADLLDDPEVRHAIRWIIDVTVASSLVGKDLAEFAHWASQAHHGARRAEALITAMAPILRARRARLKARTSWRSWDEVEIERELTSWTRLPE